MQAKVTSRPLPNVDRVAGSRSALRERSRGQRCSSAVVEIGPASFALASRWYGRLVRRLLAIAGSTAGLAGLPAAGPLAAEADVRRLDSKTEFDSRRGGPRRRDGGRGPDAQLA
jgi:hypothetical protein